MAQLQREVPLVLGPEERAGERLLVRGVGGGGAAGGHQLLQLQEEQGAEQRGDPRGSAPQPTRGRSHMHASRDASRCQRIIVPAHKCPPHRSATSGPHPCTDMQRVAQLGRFAQNGVPPYHGIMPVAFLQIVRGEGLIWAQNRFGVIPQFRQRGDCPSRAEEGAPNFTRTANPMAFCLLPFQQRKSLASHGGRASPGRCGYVLKPHGQAFCQKLTTAVRGPIPCRRLVSIRSACIGSGVWSEWWRLGIVVHLIVKHVRIFCSHLAYIVDLFFGLKVQILHIERIVT